MPDAQRLEMQPQPGPKSPRSVKAGARAFVNPYTGEVVEWYNYRETGFYPAFALHRRLLSEDWGKMVVGVSTLIFLFIIATGLVLWWPKSKAILKQRLKVKTWRGKRANHDWHVVLGFYCAIPLFIFCVYRTGLVVRVVQRWHLSDDGVIARAAEAAEERVWCLSPAASPDAMVRRVIIAEADAESWQIFLPKDATGAPTISVLPIGAPFEGATTAYHFDQYSGALLKRIRFADRNAGQRGRAIFKPVHTGSI